MKRRAFFIRLILASSALLALAVGALATDGHQVAHSGYQVADADYDLSWWTVDGGGYTFLTGGGFSLGGTAGQADAGLLAGERYTLGGGFWRGGVVVDGVHRVYLPLVLRSYP